MVNRNLLLRSEARAEEVFKFQIICPCGISEEFYTMLTSISENNEDLKRIIFIISYFPYFF